MKRIYPLLLALAVSVVVGSAAAERSKTGARDTSAEKKSPAAHTENHRVNKHGHEKDKHSHEKDKDKHGHEKDKDHAGDKHKTTSSKPAGDKPGHDEDEGNKSLVRLTNANIREAGVRVEVLSPKPIANSFTVPGEVKANAYQSALITPRISSIVVSRQAVLGDQVKKGDPLVTLFSVEMSSAQSKFIISDREWHRVRRLGQDVVAARRFLEAKIKRQEDRARLKAYGMAEAQIVKLDTDNALDKPGEFQLVAPMTGIVAADDFKVGQLIEPGKPLFEIIDETKVWVEARLDLEAAAQVKVGGKAQIVAGGRRITGTVRQIHRKIDEHTRTLGVRLEVLNNDRVLRPGQFVNVELLGRSTDAALSVPHGAILRSPDGDWIVFIEQDKGAFKPVEIKVVRKAGPLSIIEGLPSGSRVVVAGAFFLQSELAKAGFDIHNH